MSDENIIKHLSEIDVATSSQVMLVYSHRIKYQDRVFEDERY
jgi:hypothetical protein